MSAKSFQNNPYFINRQLPESTALFISAFQNFLFLTEEYIHKYISQIQESFDNKHMPFPQPLDILTELQLHGLAQKVEDEDFDQFLIHPLLSYKAKKQLQHNLTNTAYNKLSTLQFNYFEDYASMLDRAFFRDRTVAKEIIGFKLLALEFDNLLSTLSLSLSRYFYPKQIPALLFNYLLKNRKNDTLQQIVKTLLHPSYQSSLSEEDSENRKVSWMYHITYLLAKHFKLSRDPESARYFFLEFLRLHQSEDTPLQKAITGLIYAKLGDISYSLRQIEDSIDYFNQALSIYEDVLTVDFPKAEVYDGLAQIYSRKGSWDKCAEYVERSLSLYRQFNDLRGVASSLQHLGIIAQNKGEQSRSLVFYSEALEIFRSIGDLVSQASLLFNLGLLFRDAGNLNNSTIHLKQALEIYILQKDLQGLAIAYFALAGNLFFEQEYDECKDYLLKAMEFNIVIKNLEIVNQILELAENLSILTQDVGFTEKILALLPDQEDHFK